MPDPSATSATSAKPQRKYLQYWSRLRDSNRLSLVVPSHISKTVRRMVIKEKDMDVGFKILQEGSISPLCIKITEAALDDKPGFSRLVFVLERKLNL